MVEIYVTGQTVMSEAEQTYRNTKCRAEIRKWLSRPYITPEELVSVIHYSATESQDSADKLLEKIDVQTVKNAIDNNLLKLHETQLGNRKLRTTEVAAWAINAEREETGNPEIVVSHIFEEEFNEYIRNNGNAANKKPSNRVTAENKKKYKFYSLFCEALEKLLGIVSKSQSLEIAYIKRNIACNLVFELMLDAGLSQSQLPTRKSASSWLQSRGFAAPDHHAPIMAEIKNVKNILHWKLKINSGKKPKQQI